MRKPPQVNEHVALIKHLEEEGDAIYHEAVGALFAGTPDPLDVIKWKEMYDTLERRDRQLHGRGAGPPEHLPQERLRDGRPWSPTSSRSS